MNESEYICSLLTQIVHVRNSYRCIHSYPIDARRYLFQSLGRSELQSWNSPDERPKGQGSKATSLARARPGRGTPPAQWLQSSNLRPQVSDTWDVFGCEKPCENSGVKQLFVGLQWMKCELNA